MYRVSRQKYCLRFSVADSYWRGLLALLDNLSYVPLNERLVHDGGPLVDFSVYVRTYVGNI